MQKPMRFVSSDVVRAGIIRMSTLLHILTYMSLSWAVCVKMRKAGRAISIQLQDLVDYNYKYCHRNFGRSEKKTYNT